MNESKPKPVAPPWYIDAFGEHYLDLYAHRDEAEAARAVKFAIQALELFSDTPVLDLCCGAGRHLGQLRGYGIPCIGLDLSPALIRHAAETRHTVVRADAREIPLADGSFVGLLNFFSSFGYFEDEENRRMLAEARRVLKANGRALFDLMNPSHIKATLVAHDIKRTDTHTIENRRHIDAQAGRVIKEVMIESTDGGQRRYCESVRMYTPDAFDQLLLGAGFRPAARYGDFFGAHFQEHHSERQIVVAQCL